MVDDEYSLHYEFSNATTKEDIESVEIIRKNTQPPIKIISVCRYQFHKYCN